MNTDNAPETSDASDATSVDAASVDVASAAAARRSRMLLALALAALGALYVLWFRDDPHRAAAHVIFVYPPLQLSFLVARGKRWARFLSGVLALLWCSHGVMIAWSDPAHRGYALAEVVLAVAIVFAASADGLRERARKRRQARAASS